MQIIAGVIDRRRDVEFLLFAHDSLSLKKHPPLGARDESIVVPP